MIIIFYSKIRGHFTKREMNLVNRFYNTEIIEKAKKSHSSLYRDRRITFMCTMFRICRLFKLPFSLLKTISHNDFGKIMMKRFHIAVSYSGKYLFCMLSDFKAGLDAEQMRDNLPESQLKTFNHFFKADIKEPFHFFKEWTRLESMVKYFNDKGIKDFMYKNISCNEYDLETIHLLFDENYLLAVSAPNLLSIKNKIKIKSI